jgi:hypothetical protein
MNQNRSESGRFRYRKGGKQLVRDIDPDTDSDCEQASNPKPQPQASGLKPSYQPSGKEVSTLIADFTSSLAAFA